MPNTLPNTKTPHLKQNIYTEQQNPNKIIKGVTDVMQDRYAKTRVRTSMPQNVTVEINARTRAKNTKYTRSKKSSTRRQTVQIASWVDKPLRDTIHHIAQEEGLSMSQTIKALLKEILRQKLQNQHAALLPEIIENAIDRRMRQHSSRQALLLVRAIFAGEQTRNLSTNILSRQPGVTPEVLNDILDRSAEAAKSKITQTTPQLEDLIAEVKSWFEKQEGEKADD